MTTSHTLRKLIAISSAVILISLFVAYSAGAFNRSDQTQAKQDDSQKIDDSDSLNWEPLPINIGSPPKPGEVIISSSKSIIMTPPKSAIQGQPTTPEKPSK